MMVAPKLRFKADDGSDFPDWEDKTLGELFHISAGGDIDKNNCAAKQSKDYPYPVYANALVNNGTYGYANYYKIDGDTFTVTGRGDVGHAVARHCMYVPIVRLLVCQPNMDDDVDFFAEQINYTRVFIESTGVPQLTAPQLSKIKVKRPTLPEQRKIADLLSAIDAVIAVQQAEVDAWEQRKKGVMQKLFSQEVRFKADDGSEFPDWEEKTLGELCAPLTYGMNAAATKFDGENRYIRITDIDDETHVLLPNDIVSPSGELDDKYLVKKGDILLARTGASTGKSYLYHQKDGKLFYAGFLIKAHVLPSSDDYFIYSQTLTDRYWKWVKTASMRSGQPGINANEYASYSFAVPSLPEQRKIADCLSSMDEVIQKAKDELAKWRELKKGLLQQMFV